MKDNTKTSIIFILLVIVLTWRLPLSQYIRFNMRLVFMWFTVLSLAVYIAITINVWAGGFLAFALISAHIPNPTPYSGEALLMVILGSVLYLIFYNIHNKQVMLALLCLFALANVLVVSIQLLGFDFKLEVNKELFLSDGALRVGLLDNFNSLSAAFAFCLPAFFESRWKWLIPFVILGLVLAKTVGGVLATAPVILYYSHRYLSGKVPNLLQIILIVILVSVCIVGYIKFVDVPNYKSRWAAWSVYGALSTDKNHSQLFGIGLGHWKALFKREDIRQEICRRADCSQPTKGLYYAQAHNEFMQVDFEMGKIGLVLIIGYLINLLRRVRHIKDPIPILILLAIIIDSMVYFPLHIPILAMIIIMTLAMVERGLREKVA